MTGTRTWALIVVGGALAAGCSGSSFHQPPVSQFHPGSCRTAAPAILAIGTSVHDLAGKDMAPREAAPALTKNQRALVGVVNGAPEPAKGRLQDLVTAIGFYRIGVDSNSDNGKQLANLQRAQRSVITFCTTTGSTSPSPS